LAAFKNAATSVADKRARSFGHARDSFGNTTSVTFFRRMILFTIVRIDTTQSQGTDASVSESSITAVYKIGCDKKHTLGAAVPVLSSKTLAL
jgi:hypothetical protein